MLTQITNSLSLVLIINVLQKLFSYGIFFVLAMILSHETYGLFETIFSVGTFGALVFGLQAESAFSRFYYIEKDNRDIQSSVFNILLIYIFGTLLFFSVLKLEIFNLAFSSLSLYLSIFLISNLLYGLILIHFRFESYLRKYLTFIIAEILIFFVLLYLFYFNFTLSQPYLLLLFSLPKLILIIYQFFSSADFNLPKFSYGKISKYLKYSINIVPVVTISFGIILATRLFALNNFSAIELSNFSMSLRISMAYLFLNEIFRFMIDPIVIKKEKTENIDELLLNVFNSYSKILVLFNILMIFFFYILNYFFLENKFETLSVLVPPLFLSNFLNLLINYFVLLNNLSYKTHYNFISYLIGAIFFSITIYFLDINMLNLIISFLVFYFSTLLTIFFLSKKSYNLKYNFSNIFISLIILIIFIYLNYV